MDMVNDVGIACGRGGWDGWRGAKGENSDNCNSINNKILKLFLNLLKRFPFKKKTK